MLPQLTVAAAAAAVCLSCCLWRGGELLQSWSTLMLPQPTAAAAAVFLSCCRRRGAELLQKLVNPDAARPAVDLEARRLVEGLMALLLGDQVGARVCVLGGGGLAAGSGAAADACCCLCVISCDEGSCLCVLFLWGTTCWLWRDSTRCRLGGWGLVEALLALLLGDQVGGLWFRVLQTLTVKPCCCQPACGLRLMACWCTRMCVCMFVGSR
jgi:hypothetical protein